MAESRKPALSDQTEDDETGAVLNNTLASSPAHVPDGKRFYGQCKYILIVVLLADSIIYLVLS